MVVPITDEWDDPQGQFLNYDTGDVTLLDDLQGRQHTNIRSFDILGTAIEYQMYNLDLAMSALNPLDMSQLEGYASTTYAEQWTNATAGTDAALGGRNTLRISLTSVQTKDSESSSTTDLTPWNGTGSVNIALPSFPGNKLSAATVTFYQGATTYVATIPRTTTGNVNFSFPLTNLINNNITLIDKVKFSFTSSATCTVTVAALRIVSDTWTPTKLDMNTRLGRLEPIVAKDGSIPSTLLPRLWRSDTATFDDPRPINSRLAVNFYTGSKNANNILTLFLRQRREDFLTQQDLDGSPLPPASLQYGENQQTLKDRARQPDYGQAVYSTRPQSDLDTQLQSDLNDDEQVEIERLADTISESYIFVRLEYGTNNRVTIGTTETPSAYQFTVNLTASKQYLWSVDLIENALRVRVNELKSNGEVATLIFDSTAIYNEYLFKRRKGRVGWEFDIANGDSWIESVRSRGMMFGEIRTNSFESFTPVDGAQIFVGSTPHEVLSLGFNGYKNPILEIDRNNSRSDDGSVKITSKAGAGVVTSLFPVEEFAQTEVSFDLYYPTANLSLTAALMNSRGLVLPLALPAITGAGWTTVRLKFSRLDNQQTGLYQFVLREESVEVPVTWWVDNFQVVRHTVDWSGRATYDDPWDRFNNRWTHFGDKINSDTDGAIFPERGRWLQIRGQALTQNATIDKINIKPKYSELGRLTWDVGRRYQYG